MGRNSSITQHAIVLDLDETLVHTIPEGMEVLENQILNSSAQLEVRGRLYHFTLDDVFTPKGTGERNYFWGVKRPHLNLFLAFCISYFKYVIIWSAGRRPYVEAVTELIFEGIGVPDMVYNYEQCASTRGGGYHKPLSVLLNDASFAGGLRAESVFFVDDRVDNFIEHSSNAIIIPKYHPNNMVGIASDDIALLQLRQWLLQGHVIQARDVRKLNKSTIFQQPPLPPVLPSNIRTIPWISVPPLLSVTSSNNYTLEHYTSDISASTAVMV